MTDSTGHTAHPAEWLSLKAVAAELRVCDRTARRMYRAGLFRRVRQVGAGAKRPRVEVHRSAVNVKPRRSRD